MKVIPEHMEQNLIKKEDQENKLIFKSLNEIEKEIQRGKNVINMISGIFFSKFVQSKKRI